MLVYYRIYAEDGAILSKIPVAPSDPFLGRIKFTSVPPPRTVKAVRGSITKVENIKDRERTTLYFTPYSKSAMDDAEKVTILNGTGPGSTPREPLALVAKMSGFERSALEYGRVGLANAELAEPNTTPSEIRYGMSRFERNPATLPLRARISAFERSALEYGRDAALAEPNTTPSEIRYASRMPGFERNTAALQRQFGRVGLVSAAEPNTMPSEIRYGKSIQQTSLFETSQRLREVYYQLYFEGYEMPSKLANDPEEPSIGRIRADSIAPPHSPTTIKLCISRVERNPGIVNSDLYADTTCDTPLKEGHISILRTDGPGLSPNEPMAIVQADVQVGSPLPVEATSIYLIKNRAGDVYWGAPEKVNPIQTVYFCCDGMEMKRSPFLQVNEHSRIILLFRG